MFYHDESLGYRTEWILNTKTFSIFPFRLRSIGIVVFLALLWLTGVGASAQTISLNLAGGSAQWKLTGCAGQATNAGLVLQGTGSNNGQWQLPFTQLAPFTVYRFEFTARTLQPFTGGVVTAGPDFCTRDYVPSDQWQTFNYIFQTPAAGCASLHLGQWMLRGSVEFRSVKLVRLLPVITRNESGCLLGSGESTSDNTYTFVAPLGDGLTTASRPLFRFTASFNSDRWMLGPGNEVVYRQQVGDHLQQSADLHINCVYDSGCNCIVSVSRDGSQWHQLGNIRGVGSTEYTMPPSLLPAKVLFVRLTGTSAPRSSGGIIEIGGYKYHALLRSAVGDAAGTTQFMTVHNIARGVTASVYAQAELPGSGFAHLQLALRDTSAIGLHAKPTVSVNQKGKAVLESTLRTTRSALGTEMHASFVVERWGSPGVQTVSVVARHSGENLVSGDLELRNSVYYATNYGATVVNTGDAGVWWSPSPYKIPPFRPQPVARGSVHLSAARQEHTAIQLVIKPNHNLGIVTVTVSPFRGKAGQSLPSSAVTLREEDYVLVTQPTDAEGGTGLWPDPLPLLPKNWQPVTGRNNPIWLQVSVPASANAGDYTATMRISSGGWHVLVPITLHVWNFTLPLKSALRGGFGISQDTIFRYQNITTPQDKAKVWQLYMEAFQRNRLNPYDPMALSPYLVTLVHGSNGSPHVKLDFTRFDEAAHKALDEMGFNAFVIQFYGLGGGRYPNYQKGSFLGYQQGTPEYNRLMKEYGAELQEHLQKHGWLDKAYVYWTDEPQEDDFPFVKQGMEEIRRVAPRLHTILTVHITPKLFGDVNIWCSLTNQYDHAAALEQQRAGNEVWWYICTGPKEPYVGEFIDRPGIDMLMWMWQTWKYHVQGNLIWSVNYWTSTPQFPHAVQNPWKDPMSYVDGPGGVWGNGDGRYLYPANRHPNTDKTTPYVEGPVPSIRWELLGEGVEQWQYFHLLKQLVDEKLTAHDESSVVKQAESLLHIPPQICSSMTVYTHNPALLLAYRRRVAQAIEALSTNNR